MCVCVSFIWGGGGELFSPTGQKQKNKCIFLNPTSDFLCEHCAFRPVCTIRHIHQRTFGWVVLSTCSQFHTYRRWTKNCLKFGEKRGKCFRNKSDKYLYIKKNTKSKISYQYEVTYSGIHHFYQLFMVIC